MDKTNLKSLKMREQPIGRLILSMAVPAILSMLVQSLYNIVDTVFVAQISEDAVTALGVVFPMQMIVTAAAIGIGVGTNVQVARKLGEGKRDEANHIAKTGLFLSLCAAVVLAVIGLTCSGWFVRLFSDGNMQVEQMGSSYLTIVMSLSAFVMVEVCVTKILQATGNMRTAMICQLIGAGVNIALDPLFIFVFDMGVSGAAIATVIAQGCAMIFCLFICAYKKQDVNVFLNKDFKLRGNNISAIFAIGLPTFVMNSVASFTVIILNTFLLKISTNGIAVLGVYYKMQSFVFMPVFGLMQGIVPILSYNYGSGDKTRYNRTLKIALITSVSIMAFGVILFQAAPGLLMNLFNAEKNGFKKEGEQALRLISICFMFAAFNIVTTTCMQSLNKGLSSLLLSLFRQIVILIPVAAIFTYTVGIPYFWLCFPIAEAGVFLIYFPYTLYSIKRKFLLKTNNVTEAIRKHQQ